MSEWQGCEAIVKQREREQHAAALAKCSSGASIDSGSQKLLHRDSTLSNEVSLTWGGGSGPDLAQARRGPGMYCRLHCMYDVVSERSRRDVSTSVF